MAMRCIKRGEQVSEIAKDFKTTEHVIWAMLHRKGIKVKDLRMQALKELWDKERAEEAKPVNV